MDYGQWLRYHVVLGLQPGASKAEVHRAYRRLTREDSAQTTHTFGQLQEAYEALRDFEGRPPKPEDPAARLSLRQKVGLGASAMALSVGLMVAAHYMSKQRVPASGEPEPGTEEREVIRTPKGEFELVYMSGAKDVIERLHAQRRDFFEKAANDPGAMEREDARLRSLGDDVSLFLGFNRVGKLVGVLKRTRDPLHPYQLWAYDIFDGPPVARVVVRGSLEVPDSGMDPEGGEPIVFFHGYTKDGRRLGGVWIKAFDSRLSPEDFGRRVAR